MIPFVVMYVDYIRLSETKKSYYSYSYSLLRNSILFLSVSFNPVFVSFELVLYMLALSAVLTFSIINLFNSIDVVGKKIFRAFVLSWYIVRYNLVQVVSL